VMAVLTDDHLVSVQSPVFFYPQATGNYNLSAIYPISNTSLQTGDYYMLVRANNESNYRNKYQKIFINGLPLQFEDVVVLTEKATNLIHVSSISEYGTVDSLFEIYGDYASSESDSEHKRLYIAGINFINLIAYDLQSAMIVWTKDVEPPLPVHAPDCLHFDEELFSSFASYDIFGYLYNGSVTFTASVEEGLKPSRIFKFGEFLIADLQSKTGDNNFIATYYLVSGSEKQRLANYFKVVDFFALSDDLVLILANDNDGGIIMEYEPQNNILTDVVEAQAALICSVKVSETEFVIGTDNGNFIFKAGQASLAPVLQGISPKRLRFDPANQKIYSAGPNLIKVISYPNLTVLDTYTLTDSILNFHLIFNK